MAGDDVNERDALRQVLEEKCPDAIGIVEDDDISKLVAAGYFTTDALALATKDDLNAVLPGRRGVVVSLLNAFVQPAGGLTKVAWLRQQLPPLRFGNDPPGHSLRRN